MSIYSLQEVVADACPSLHPVIIQDAVLIRQYIQLYHGYSSI